MRIEVFFASKVKQQTLLVFSEKPLSIKDAIIKSKILDIFSEINLNYNKVGIFGEIKSLDYLIEKSLRVEIYRELILDPKSARAKRAEKKRKDKNLNMFGA